MIWKRIVGTLLMAPLLGVGILIAGVLVVTVGEGIQKTRAVDFVAALSVIGAAIFFGMLLVEMWSRGIKLWRESRVSSQEGRTE